ncbi:helix-turn-helix transcriptional regulator [Altererythrobacter sp. GH1-8]|uniref:helix-turn-helix transcriptional regulator n=1 Tax=Altererythrobacter sp. GH1-8 TaxID=3349333 RepID=UPI00374DE6CF
MKPLLDTRAAAPLIGHTEGTLENWRVQGVGPKFIKSGRKVLYDPDDIEAWRKSRRFQSTSEAEAA